MFKTYGVRRNPGPGGVPGPALLAAGGLESRARLDESARNVLKEMVEFARPHFRA